MVTGQAPEDSAYTRAAEIAAATATPIDDTRGTAAQRRHLVAVLVRRALQGAVKRANSGNTPEKEA